jgi:hypothetical protein
VDPSLIRFEEMNYSEWDWVKIGFIDWLSGLIPFEEDK